DSALPALDGDSLPFASDFSIAGAIEYKWQLSEKLGARVEVNSKYQSGFTTGVDSATADAFIQDGYGLIDARAAIDFPNGVELGVWGRNLTSSDYAVSGYQFFGPTTFRGTPRTYGVSARYAY
ncbi:TonB-dependent receptor, partial [Hellea sp.]|nr:TonB-dependent receptor [Hellea sp.]